MLGNYRKIYSSQEVMSKKLCFSIAILHFNPVLSIIASNSPKSLPMSTKSFTAEQISEMREYLSNYNEKPYVDSELLLLLPRAFSYDSSFMKNFNTIDVVTQKLQKMTYYAGTDKTDVPDIKSFNLSYCGNDL